MDSGRYNRDRFVVQTVGKRDERQKDKRTGDQDKKYQHRF